MARRSGSADLPLHGGQVPKWLADRMTRLGAVMAQAVVHHYGRDELLRRLANPFWFQAFGAVMGMDWHSSGITTSVIGALRRGLTPLQKELGVHVRGGRGRYSRQTPSELIAIGDQVGWRTPPPPLPCHRLSAGAQGCERRPRHGPRSGLLPVILHDVKQPAAWSPPRSTSRSRGAFFCARGRASFYIHHISAAFPAPQRARAPETLASAAAPTPK
jgi:uncharacterized protein DUF763